MILQFLKYAIMQAYQLKTAFNSLTVVIVIILPQFLALALPKVFFTKFQNLFEIQLLFN